MFTTDLVSPIPFTAVQCGDQGTLTSDPFVIRGDRLSFLVGGGCEITEQFVELLVDGEASWTTVSVPGRHSLT